MLKTLVKNYCIYIIFIMSILFINICSVCLANPVHDIQDSIPMDKALHFAAGYIISDQLQRNVSCSAFEAFLITSAIAWGKEKWIDDSIDNNDAYATMAGGLFYQIKF